ncbi:hypothetical protein M1D52_19525 [Olivibacter sp. SA151]
MSKIKAMWATLHLMAKHSWRVLEPFHFLNPLAYYHMNRSANALLLVASVSHKAVLPTHSAKLRAEEMIRPVKSINRWPWKMSPRKFAVCTLMHYRLKQSSKRRVFGYFLRKKVTKIIVLLT